MSLSLIVVSLGAAVAVAGTGVLVALCARAPRASGALGVHMVAWTVAIFGLAVALGCQVIGDLAGYNALMFRAMELGGQLVAPLALCLGLAQVVGRSVQARFAMWLAVAALTVVAVVILGTDPLSQDVAFSKRWPDPTAYYQLAPRAVLQVLAVFSFLIAVIATLVTTFRSRRGNAATTEIGSVVSASGAAVLLAVPGLAMLAHLAAGLNLPLSGRSIFALVCTGAAGLTLLAGIAGAHLQRFGASGGARAGGRGARRDDWGESGLDDGSYRDDEFDRFDPVSRVDRYSDPGLDGMGGSRAGGRGTAHPDNVDPEWGEPTGGRSGDDAGEPVRYPGLAALAAEAGGPPADRYDDVGRYDEVGPYDETGRYDDAGRFGDARPYDEAGPYPEPDRGGYADGHPYGDGTGYGAAAGPADPSRPFVKAGYDVAPNGDAPAQLFGQITIYTLIEERSSEFDRLTERIVSQVKDQEPGTLAYIVHAVPTAPMQRILYEVYRDRLAYDDHLRQPYIGRYEAERRPLVLATNVIELGLQQAKVSPFPLFSTISDILSESGIDLTGVTRSSRGGGSSGGGSSSHTALGQPSAAPPVPAEGPPGGPWSDPRSSDRGYQNPYQGWDEIRGEDQRRR